MPEKRADPAEKPTRTPERGADPAEEPGYVVEEAAGTPGELFCRAEKRRDAPGKRRVTPDEGAETVWRGFLVPRLCEKTRRGLHPGERASRVLHSAFGAFGRLRPALRAAYLRHAPVRGRA